MLLPPALGRGREGGWRAAGPAALGIAGGPCHEAVVIEESSWQRGTVRRVGLCLRGHRSAVGCSPGRRPAVRATLTGGVSTVTVPMLFAARAQGHSTVLQSLLRRAGRTATEPGVVLTPADPAPGTAHSRSIAGPQPGSRPLTCGIRRFLCCRRLPAILVSVEQRDDRDDGGGGPHHSGEPDESAADQGGPRAHPRARAAEHL